MLLLQLCLMTETGNICHLTPDRRHLWGTVASWDPAGFPWNLQGWLGSMWDKHILESWQQSQRQWVWYESVSGKADGWMRWSDCQRGFVSDMTRTPIGGCCCRGYIALSSAEPIYICFYNLTFFLSEKQHLYTRKTIFLFLRLFNIISRYQLFLVNPWLYFPWL